jgi:hydantoinase/carbamoylase family amidase
MRSSSSASAESLPQASAARITRMLHRIGGIGDDHRGGVSRLAFTADERAAHHVVAEWLAELGLDVRHDPLGNTVAELVGDDPTARAIGIGSHLDSVPHGGHFDGVVGVVGAVELVRLLRDAGWTLSHSLRVVAFAGEEGARFGEPCIGSKGVTGRLAADDLDRLIDRADVSLRSALLSVGLEAEAMASARWSADDWAAFLELHIEQGATLYREGVGIGVVDIVSGSTRFMITMSGRAGHSGATPMHERVDALYAAAEVVSAIEGLVLDPQHHAVRATVGVLDVEPNSVTTIPGRVRFSVDIRDVDHDRQRATSIEVTALAQAIGERRGIGVAVTPLADTVPTVLPVWLRGIAVEACAELGQSYRVVTSGASHDAQIINAIVPSAVIFVPSREGHSHVPEEWTSSSDIARGVDVLLGTVIRLDRLLAS